MPQSGDVIVSGREEDKDHPWSLLVFSLIEGKLWETRRRSSSCGHKGAAFTSPLIIDERELLVVSCVECDDLKLVDIQTGKWSTAFLGCKPSALCSGGSDTIFVQSREDQSILQLDCTNPTFKGPIRTLQTDIYSLAMCYIPQPINNLVISPLHTSKVIALSVERDDIIWEIQLEKGRIYHDRIESVFDRTGLLFHPEHRVLFVTNAFSERVSIVGPGNGVLIQDTDLPEIGFIDALGMHKNQLVMLYNKDGLKISYYDLCKNKALTQ